MSKSITELVKEAHDNAVNKGFYDCPECDDGKIYIDDFAVTCGRCKGTHIDLKKNIGELLVLVTSELGEALEAHRIDRHADFNHFNMCQNDEHIYFEEGYRASIKNTFEDELSDVAIRLFDLCGYMNIDLERHIELKMSYNETREYKHGKRY